MTNPHRGIRIPSGLLTLRKCVSQTIGFRTFQLGHVPDQNVGPMYCPHHAHAYASTRGSAPALSTPVFGSTMIPAFEPCDHAAATFSLWPRATSACRTGSGIRASTDISPGYIVCGNGDAGKLRVDHRGAS